MWGLFQLPDLRIKSNATDIVTFRLALPTVLVLIPHHHPMHIQVLIGVLKRFFSSCLIYRIFQSFNTAAGGVRVVMEAEGFA